MLADLAGFLDDMQQHLRAVDIPAHETEEALQVLYRRIEGAYLAEARHEVSSAMAVASDAIHTSIASKDVEEHLRAASQAPDLNSEGKRASMLPTGSIEPLVEFIQSSKIVANKPQVICNLTEIDADLQHFRNHRTFRRREWLPKVAH